MCRKRSSVFWALSAKYGKSPWEAKIMKTQLVASRDSVVECLWTIAEAIYLICCRPERSLDPEPPLTNMLMQTKTERLGSQRFIKPPDTDHENRDPL